MQAIAATAFVAALASLATSAAAQDDAVWLRTQNPDGAFSVELPCDHDAIEEQDDGESVGMACFWGEVLFGAVLTRDGLGSETYEGARFEGMLAEARNDPETERIEMAPSASVRAFRAWKRQDGPFGIAQFSEGKEGELIVLAVMEDPDWSAGQVDRARAEQMAVHFFDSLTTSVQ